jgi:CBS-domain-containing membrane protein
MKQLLTFGAAVAFAIAIMNFPQVVKTPLGLTVVKGGGAFAADLGSAAARAVRRQRQGTGCR